MSIAVVRIRGGTGLSSGVRDTFTKLRLYRQNYCIIIPDNSSMLGMVKKVKDYVTWGEVAEETEKLLHDSRLSFTVDEEGKRQAKKFYRLSPPRQGFGRKGVKVNFSIGGALGYRGEHINKLIRKMI